jgi:hypothetical protein
MSGKDTLPAAVDFDDRHSLSGIDDARLEMLLADCEDWRAWMQGFREGLITPAGRTEWNILMRQEHEDVAAAHSRLQDEIAARRTS